MASQNTLYAISTLTHKAIPKFLKPGHLHTTLVPDHRHMWSFSNSDRLKCSNPSKPYESFYKSMRRPHLQCMPEDTVVKHAKLVISVRELITNDIDDIKFDDLLMIDALERLGLDYLYEDEINVILEKCYLQLINKDFLRHRNLYEVSLCFRILRQKGFRVSADIFEVFKGKNGEFVENLKYDIRGLMELYEASHFCIEGENILDEAAIFSSNMLLKTINFLDGNEARMVRYTLENPQRRNFTSFSLLNSPKGFDIPILKELAELDYTMVQSIRKMEINEILS